MSEFTDYMALHTAAESLGALEAAIVQSVGAAEVPLELLPLGEGAGQTAATAAWGAVEKPLWVLLGSDALVEDLARAGRAFHLMVEDDLSTWALAVHFADFTTVLAFPRDPEAARVATVQYLETQVYDTQANDVEMAQIAEYFGVDPDALSETFVPDGGQAFSALIGAPYEQMVNLSTPGLDHGQVVFRTD